MAVQRIAVQTHTVRIEQQEVRNDDGTFSTIDVRIEETITKWIEVEVPETLDAQQEEALRELIDDHLTIGEDGSVEFDAAGFAEALDPLNPNFNPALDGVTITPEAIERLETTLENLDEEIAALPGFEDGFDFAAGDPLDVVPTNGIAYEEDLVVLQTDTSVVQIGREQQQTIDDALALATILETGDARDVVAFFNEPRASIEEMAAEMSAHVVGFEGTTEEALLDRIEAKFYPSLLATQRPQETEILVPALMQSLGRPGPHTSSEEARVAFLTARAVLDFIGTGSTEAMAGIMESLVRDVAAMGDPALFETAAQVFHSLMSPGNPEDDAWLFQPTELPELYAPFEESPIRWLAGAAISYFESTSRPDVGRELAGLILGDEALVQAGQVDNGTAMIQNAETPEEVLVALTSVSTSNLPALVEQLDLDALQARFGDGEVLTELISQMVIDGEVSITGVNEAITAQRAFAMRTALAEGDFAASIQGLRGLGAQERLELNRMFERITGMDLPAAVAQGFGEGSGEANVLIGALVNGINEGALLGHNFDEMMRQLEGLEATVEDVVEFLMPAVIGPAALIAGDVNLEIADLLRGFTEADTDMVLAALESVAGDPGAINELALGWAAQQGLEFSGSEGAQATQARAALHDWIHETFPGALGGHPSRVAAFADMVLAPTVSELTNEASLDQFMSTIDLLYTMDRGSGVGNWWAATNNPFEASQVTLAYEQLSALVDEARGSMPLNEAELQAIAEQTYRLLGAMDSYLVARGETAARDRLILSVGAALVAGFFTGGASVAVQAVAMGGSAGAAAMFANVVEGENDLYDMTVDVGFSAVEGAISPLGPFGSVGSSGSRFLLNDLITSAPTTFVYSLTEQIASGADPMEALQSALLTTAVMTPVDLFVGQVFTMAGHVAQGIRWNTSGGQLSGADIDLPDGRTARMSLDADGNATLRLGEAEATLVQGPDGFSLHPDTDLNTRAVFEAAGLNLRQMGEAGDPLSATRIAEMQSRYPQYAELEVDGAEIRVASSETVTASDLAGLATALGGREVSLIQLPDGSRVIRSGSADSIAMNPGEVILAQIHPSGDLQLSQTDLDFLASNPAQNNQVVLVDLWGNARVIEVDPATGDISSAWIPGNRVNDVRPSIGTSTIPNNWRGAIEVVIENNSRLLNAVIADPDTPAAVREMAIADLDEMYRRFGQLMQGADANGNFSSQADVADFNDWFVERMPRYQPFLDQTIARGRFNPNTQVSGSNSAAQTAVMMQVMAREFGSLDTFINTHIGDGAFHVVGVLNGGGAPAGIFWDDVVSSGVDIRGGQFGSLVPTARANAAASEFTLSFEPQPGDTVVLVDDLVSGGETINNALRSLRAQYPDVNFVVVAQGVEGRVSGAPHTDFIGAYGVSG